MVPMRCLRSSSCAPRERSSNCKSTAWLNSKKRMPRRQNELCKNSVRSSSAEKTHFQLYSRRPRFVRSAKLRVDYKKSSDVFVRWFEKSQPSLAEIFQPGFASTPGRLMAESGWKPNLQLFPADRFSFMFSR